MTYLILTLCALNGACLDKAFPLYDATLLQCVMYAPQIAQLARTEIPSGVEIVNWRCEVGS